MTKPELEENQVDLTPMIDVVFLLLIFFMVTMRIVQEETQLEVPLPQSAIHPPPPPKFPPQDIEVEIAGDGKVVVDGISVGGPGDSNLTGLANYFYRQGQLAIRDPESKVIVSIKPDKMARHKHTTNVLNALAKANEGLEGLQASNPRKERKILNKVAFH